jgi:hypothetical protein
MATIIEKNLHSCKNVHVGNRDRREAGRPGRVGPASLTASHRNHKGGASFGRGGSFTFGSFWLIAVSLARPAVCDSPGGGHMQLSVQTSGGLPAFKLSAEATDTVDALLSAAAKKCRLSKEDIRFSSSGRVLSGGSTVQALGLSEGDALLLHVKIGQQPTTSHRSSPAPSFGTQGYGFFVNVVTSTGRTPRRTTLLLRHFHLGLEPSPFMMVVAVIIQRARSPPIPPQAFTSSAMHLLFSAAHIITLLTALGCVRPHRCPPLSRRPILPAKGLPRR